MPWAQKLRGAGYRRAPLRACDVAAAEVEIVGLFDLTGPGFHDHKACGEEKRFFHRVGDEEHHLAGAVPDIEDEFLHLLACQRIERAERLIHQEHGGVGGKRAGDADALLHAAGKLVDHFRAEFIKAHQLELFHGHRLAFGSGHAAHLQAEGDIIHHVQPWHERVFLENHAPVSAWPLHGLAVEQDIAFRRRKKARKHGK
jgi:hypothetical protein